MTVAADFDTGGRRLLVSHPSPDGSVVVADFPAGSALLARFVDDPDDVAGGRDLSVMVPDLLLIGLAASVSETAPAGELVVVGRVELVGPAPTVLFAHPAAQLCRQVSPGELVPLVERGIAVQVAAGVAAERQAEQRDDAAPASPLSAADGASGGDRESGPIESGPVRAAGAPGAGGS
jgi:hypothetical protein